MKIKDLSNIASRNLDGDRIEGASRNSFCQIPNFSKNLFMKNIL